LYGGCDGSAGEAYAVAEGFDGLWSEVVEDFKEGKIGLGSKAGGAHTVFIFLSQLLVQLPKKNEEVFA
jgi:hypothetical protein